MKNPLDYLPNIIFYSKEINLSLFPPGWAELTWEEPGYMQNVCSTSKVTLSQERADAQRGHWGLSTAELVSLVTLTQAQHPSQVHSTPLCGVSICSCLCFPLSASLSLCLHLSHAHIYAHWHRHTLTWQSRCINNATVPEMQYCRPLGSTQHASLLTDWLSSGASSPMNHYWFPPAAKTKATLAARLCIPFAFPKYPYHVASQKFTVLSWDEIAPFLPGITHRNMVLFCFWTYCIW